MTTVHGLLRSTAGTEALGAALARRLATGWVFLEGDLGAGKTTLARAWLAALGYGEAVRSPTFTLLEPYEGSDRTVLHLDLYRIGDPEEVAMLGLEDWCDRPVVVLIEWAARGADALPGPDLRIHLSHAPGWTEPAAGTEPAGATGPEVRRVTLEGCSEEGRRVLADPAVVSSCEG